MLGEHGKAYDVFQ
jgi:tetratricopeptide repeat protein 21B